MGSDYDLVVVGNSLVSRWATLQATQLHARVAWVQPQPTHHPAELEASFDLSQRLSNSFAPSQSQIFSNLTEIQAWIDSRNQSLIRPYHLQQLAQAGVDVMTAQGQFKPLAPKAQNFGLDVEGQMLRSRFFLIVSDTIQGEPLQYQAKVQDFNALLQAARSIPPHSPIYLEGTNPWAVLGAQILNQQGFSVTLIAPILPKEDRDLAFLMQCQLEAQGICVVTPDAARAIASANPDRLFWQTPTTEKHFQALQIPPDLMPRLHPQNLRLGKTNLYVCGAIRGGYALPNLTQQEAAIALQNSLFNQKHRLAYHQMAYSLPIQGGCIRIGPTEYQARQQDPNIETLTQSQTLTPSQPTFCKLIAHNQGRILGIHSLGLTGQNTVRFFEEIVQKGICVSELRNVNGAEPELRAIFDEFANRWDQVKHPQKRDRLEQYFRRQRKQFS